MGHLQHSQETTSWCPATSAMTMTALCLISAAVAARWRQQLNALARLPCSMCLRAASSLAPCSALRSEWTRQL
jgi:hypothetical protein